MEVTSKMNDISFSTHLVTLKGIQANKYFVSYIVLSNREYSLADESAKPLPSQNLYSSIKK